MSDDDERRFTQACDDFYTYRDYRRVGSTDRALRFLEAVDYLLGIRPKRSRHGQDEEAEFDQATLKQVRDEAKAYVREQSATGKSRVRFGSFAGFRE